MARLWVRIIEKHRIARQATAPCTPSGAAEALAESVLSTIRLPTHSIFTTDSVRMRIKRSFMHKQEHEFEAFRHTAFLPEHFMEDVPFDRLEIEYLDDTGKKRRSNDPRNQFDGF